MFEDWDDGGIGGVDDDFTCYYVTWQTPPRFVDIRTKGLIGF